MTTKKNKGVLAHIVSQTNMYNSPLTGKKRSAGSYSASQSIKKQKMKMVEKTASVGVQVIQFDERNSSPFLPDYRVLECFALSFPEHLTISGLKRKIFEFSLVSNTSMAGKEHACVHLYKRFSPDGQGYMYSIRNGGRFGNSRVLEHFDSGDIVYCNLTAPVNDTGGEMKNMEKDSNKSLDKPIMPPTTKGSGSMKNAEPVGNDIKEKKTHVALAKKGHSKLVAEKSVRIEKPADRNPEKTKMDIKAPEELKTVDTKSVDTKSVEKKPLEKKSIDKKPLEKKPIDKKATDKNLTEKKPVDKKQTNKKSMDKKSMDKKQKDKQPDKEKSTSKHLVPWKVEELSKVTKSDLFAFLKENAPIPISKKIKSKTRKSIYIQCYEEYIAFTKEIDRKNTISSSKFESEKAPGSSLEKTVAKLKNSKRKYAYIFE